MSATSLQHKQKEICTLSFYSEYFSLCISLPQPCCPLGACALKGFADRELYWWNLCWKQSSAKQNILSCNFLTQLFKCPKPSCKDVPASLHLLQVNAFADQDFLTASTLATLCRHCCSGNVIKIWGSSTKQLLYFGAGLLKFLLGEQADVQMGCTPSWAWCFMGLSVVMLFACTVSALVWPVHSWHCKTPRTQELQCKSWTDQFLWSL